MKKRGREFSNVSKTNFKLLYLNTLNGNLHLAEFMHKLEMETRIHAKEKMKHLLTRKNEVTQEM